MPGGKEETAAQKDYAWGPDPRAKRRCFELGLPEPKLPYSPTTSKSPSSWTGLVTAGLEGLSSSFVSDNMLVSRAGTRGDERGAKFKEALILRCQPCPGTTLRKRASLKMCA